MAELAPNNNAETRKIFLKRLDYIYKLFEDYASKLYITRVHGKFNKADVFYEYNIENFIEVNKVTYKKDEYNDYNYDIYTYIKI